MGWVAVVLFLTAAPVRLGAQSSLQSGNSPQGNSANGFEIESISGFAGWQSVVNPQGSFFQPGLGLQSDETLGGAATVGWWRRGKKSNLSASYTASYSGQIRYSDLSALSQYFTFNGSRQLGRKWTVGFSGSSAISTYDQLLFQPTILSGVTAAPGSFDDLAAALLAGKYNNDQLASLLTGSPVIESPARTLFFGNRVFTSSASASLSYAHSQRLTISFSTSASRAEHLKGGAQQSIPQNVYLIPVATEGSANVAISYALTPRTQTGVNLSSSRGFSQIDEAYTTSASAFIGRTIARHWMAQVHGGGGFVSSIRSQTPNNRGTTPVYGVNVGYKIYAHSFIAAYDRSLSQSYGVGASDSMTANAAWHWWRPGRSWGLNSSYLRMQFRNGLFGNINGWRASFGMNREMGGHMMLETAYTYGSYASNAALSPYSSDQSAVRVSLLWSPRGQERR